MKDKVRSVAGAGLLALLPWAAIGCGAGEGTSGSTAQRPTAISTPVSAPVTPVLSVTTAPAPAVGQSPTAGEPSSRPAIPSTAASTPASATPPPSAPLAGTPIGGAGQVVGTMVRFSAGSTSVEVTIDQDNPAVRDFLSLLPLTLTVEEFAGKEKIAYLPRKLAYSDAPGADPEDGDLIYYSPWGNLGFYYDASGIGYSDQTIHIGTYTASRAQLDQLASQPVAVEIVR